MNPGLQVEHGVTECVFGIDLVRLQLLVAEGSPLPMAGPPPMRGHAMEGRIAAEDPAYAWLPSTGTLHRLAVPAAATPSRPLVQPRLRLDAGGEAASLVAGPYHPLPANLIPSTPCRRAAA